MKDIWLQGTLALIVGALCFTAGYLYNLEEIEEDYSERLCEKLWSIEDGCIIYTPSPFDARFIGGRLYNTTNIDLYLGNLGQCIYYSLDNYYNYQLPIVYGYAYIEDVEEWYLHCWNLDYDGNIVDVDREAVEGTPYTTYYGYQLNKVEVDELYNYYMGYPREICK